MNLEGMDRFCIVHLSDLHLSKRGDTGDEPVNRYNNQLLLSARPVIEGMWKKEPKPDAVVVTGDVSHAGTSSCLKAAEELLFNARLSLLGCVPRDRVLLVPGNFDRHVNENHPWKMYSTEFDHAFRYKGPVADWRITNASGKKLIIAGLDLTPKHMGPASAQGQLTEAVEKRLVDISSDSREQEIPLIWALHYAPCRPDVDLGRELLNELDLLTLKGTLNPEVQVILCGHLSQPAVVQARPRIGMFKEKTLIFGCGTSSTFPKSFDQPHFCKHVLYVEDGRVWAVETTHYCYVVEQGVFTVSNDVTEITW